jgi:hypothetical protein
MKKEREFELLLTPSDGRVDNRRGGKEDSRHNGENQKRRAGGKQQRLSAILCAPDFIHDLYRQGLIAQELAAPLGPDPAAEPMPG